MVKTVERRGVGVVVAVVVDTLSILVPLVPVVDFAVVRPVTTTQSISVNGGWLRQSLLPHLPLLVIECVPQGHCVLTLNKN